MVTKKDLLYFAITLAVFAADQAAKLLIRQLETPIILSSFFQIAYIKNTGAAFGLFQNSSTALGIIGMIVTAIIIYSYRRLPESTALRAGLALILAGTIGNIYDRLAYGFVTDFIGFSFWPAFNIADASLTIGAILIAYSAAKERMPEQKATSKA
ncbi:signal peptidase II [Candidatus Woesearchaeota archaeon]|nr:signal peptidase II [Candidatus Woesearchaeota archaeon]